MNMQPDLFRHPKFLVLAREVGDRALEYLARLWAHCQENKRGSNWGKVDPLYIEVVADWRGEAGALWKALTEPRIPGKGAWIDLGRNGVVRIHDWEEHNAKLVFAWRNGGLSGGRPKKSQGKPTANPSETHGLSQGKPTANPSGKLRTGLDREEGKEGIKSPNSRSGPSLTPTFEQVMAYSTQLRDPDGDSWSEAAVREAWISLEARKNPDTGQWPWGKGWVTDWRAAIEARLSAQAKKAALPTSVLDLKTRLAELERQRDQHPANQGSAYGVAEPAPEQVADYKRICREISEIRKRIGGES